MNVDVNRIIMKGESVDMKKNNKKKSYKKPEIVNIAAWGKNHIIVS